MILSEEQKAAIKSKYRLICILACAGSGKTTTLTNRIARLINVENVDPSTIAAITFTVLAGEQLKYEIANLAKDKAAISAMFIGTIHSFCFHLLQAERALTIESISPITEGQKFVLLSKYWSTWEIHKVAPSVNKTILIENLIMSFEIIKMNSISIDVLIESHNDLARVYRRYNKYLEENGYVDFADMLVMVRNLLSSDTAIKENVNNKYRYIFIDEFQDVDPVQASIVNILKNNSNICVVGDDDQAIYQFRGADERNIQYFVNQPCCETYPLSENRRCPKNILAISENSINKIKSRLSKNMFTNIPNGILVAKQFEKIKDEVSFIKEEIVRLKRYELIKSYSQIGILMRSLASNGGIYIDMLKETGIPYVARGAKALFDSGEISKIISIIEWFAKDDDLIKHLEILTPVLSKKPDVGRLSQFSDRSSLITKGQWIMTGMQKKDWIILCELHNKRIRYEERKFGSLLELIHDFIEILDLMSPNSCEVSKYNIAQFTRIVNEYEMIQNNRNFRSLGSFLAAYAEKTYDEETPIEKFDDAVNILTVHQAKGLEYDYVFLPMLVEKRFPIETSRSRWLIDESLFDAKRYITTIDNERRLFYVACTRAKRILYLLASEDVGLKNNKKPSIFWEEAKEIKLPDKNCEPPVKSVKREKKRKLNAGYSSLEYYLTCPYRYLLIVEYGLTFPQVIYFQFGKLMHDVFAYINTGWKDNINITAESAHKFFDEKFILYYKNTNMREYDIRKQKYRGKKIIDMYFHSKQDWYEDVIDVEKEFYYFSDLALIKGRYDVLLRNSRGKYTIMDYKTGHAHAGLRPDFQMQFYSISAITQMNLDVDENIIYYVEDENLIRYEVTPDFIDSGKKNLENTIKGIISKDFHANPNKGVCSQCEVNKICPNKYSEENRRTN